MIFQELILRNFGPYRDRQIINLLPQSEPNRRPIILVGGLNGGGKTTLLDAVRLVLYGQRAQCSTRGKLAYHDFLNQSRNRQAGDQATTLKLRFQLYLTYTTQPSEFHIQRT